MSAVGTSTPVPFARYRDGPESLDGLGLVLAGPNISSNFCRAIGYISSDYSELISLLLIWPEHYDGLHGVAVARPCSLHRCRS